MTNLSTTLALECACAGLSLALRKGDTTIAFTTATPRSSDILPTELQNLMQQACVEVSDIDHILVTTGPGSFTGIRLGLATAEAFKLLNPAITLIGLSTLQVVAAQIVEEHRPQQTFTVLLDAAGGQVYAQHFQANGQPISEAVCTPEPTVCGLAFVQNGLMYPGTPFATLDARYMLALAKHKEAHLPPQPVYLKPLTYKKAQ